MRHYAAAAVSAMPAASNGWVMYQSPEIATEETVIGLPPRAPEDATGTEPARMPASPSRPVAAAPLARVVVDLPRCVPANGGFHWARPPFAPAGSPLRGMQPAPLHHTLEVGDLPLGHGADAREHLLGSSTPAWILPAGLGTCALAVAVAYVGADAVSWASAGLRAAVGLFGA